MSNIAIFRFSPTEGPGYFATWLAQQGHTANLIAIDQGDAIPAHVNSYDGFAFMGGPMSVNDDLPWIPPVLDLIRSADGAGKPCIGHCLGGQLIAKALGAAVQPNATREIGWGTVFIEANSVAREWLGDAPRELAAFQWHGETFALPPGAVRILTGDYCTNQAYVVRRHLGMQCHVEMTPEMVRTWCADGAAEIADHPGPAVQSVATIEARISEQLPALRSLADRLYTRWAEGLLR